MRLARVAVAALALAGIQLADASQHSATRYGHQASARAVRSPQARYQFKKKNPCPATGKSSGACPGYVIDHVIPLKRGGPDSSANMQWQTIVAAREKDRWE